MQITAHKLHDTHYGNEWHESIESRWEYNDFVSDKRWRRGWISFDCLAHDPGRDTVLCGITSFDADIFHGWRRSDKSWVDPGYSRVADPFDAKFHRSLERDSRTGCFYAAPALLHDIDRFNEAPGGAIVRYDPGRHEITKLAIPVPHVYIQSLVLDEARDTLYAQTFTPELLIAYHLRTSQSRVIGPIGSAMGLAQGENLVLDDDGCVWGSWGVTRAWQSSPGADQYRLFKYDPRLDKIMYLDKGLPREDRSYGYDKPEGFFNFGTGNLYVSGGSGALYRVDSKTGDAEFLFRAIGDEGRGRRSRLASMRLGPDGFAYGVTGRDGECEILRFNPRDESYEMMGLLRDSAGVAAWQIHDVCLTPDGTLYAGENDHPKRSSYLWEVQFA